MNSSPDPLRGSSRGSSLDPLTKNEIATSSQITATDSLAVLVREAGAPFQRPVGNLDPFVEWLSLMEVVQMLCPAWPARDAPLLGNQWKL